MKEFSDYEVRKQVKKLKAFEKMYDLIRLVDPVRKSVINLIEDKICITGSKCYETWQKGKICDNCVSIRAYNDNQTYVKIEYNYQKIFMVTAMPFAIKDKVFVLELLKDATKVMFTENIQSNSLVDVYTLIDQLNMATLKDGLTNVYNRRFINERLPVDIVSAIMKDEELAIIFCDLDYFKTINDLYGHLAGDQVLKRFSKILEYCIRKNDDWVARYGGGEFLVCLKNTDRDGASTVAERIRKTMEGEVFLLSNDIVHITASFGIASIKELEDISYETIIECADKKLLMAKQKGRNRVEK